MAFGSSANSETVLFRYPVRLDVFQRPVAGSATEVIVEDCLFAPGTGGENQTHANQVVADATLYAPPESPAITAADQVVARGEIYEVIEKPRLWTNEGYEIPLRRVTG
jgi:hypothetical protein